MEFKIDYKDVQISETEIANMIGYSSNDIPDMVKLLIHDILKEIGSLCSIVGGFKLFNQLAFEKDAFSINEIIFSSDKIIAASLKEADSIAVFVCTAGEDLSKWSKKLFQKEDAVKAYIADIAASMIVEKAMDQIQNNLEKLVHEKQQKITNRYSPGYCGWSVEEQHRLFSLLEDNYCGVSLNEAALMNPIKSVSGVIGIGTKVKKAAYQCNKCEKTDCLLNNKQ